MFSISFCVPRSQDPLQLDTVSLGTVMYVVFLNGLSTSCQALKLRLLVFQLKLQFLKEAGSPSTFYGQHFHIEHLRFQADHCESPKRASVNWNQLGTDRPAVIGFNPTPSCHQLSSFHWHRGQRLSRTSVSSSAREPYLRTPLTWRQRWCWSAFTRKGKTGVQERCWGLVGG